MKVNNITRLLVACLWCCSILIAANPYDQKPIEDKSAKKEAAYKAEKEAINKQQLEKDAEYKKAKKEATYKSLNAIEIESIDKADDTSYRNNKKAA